MDLLESAKANQQSLGRWEAVVFEYVRLLEGAGWLSSFPGISAVLESDLESILSAAGIMPEVEGACDCPAIGNVRGHDGSGFGAATVLIVDDTPEALVRTFRRLAGWPGVSVSAWLFERRFSESREEALSRASAAVREFQADIIVMDQQMPPISGAELMVRLEKDSGRNLIFVGNSAAWPEPLNAAGAIGNMEKGRHVGPFKEALSRLSGGRP